MWINRSTVGVKPRRRATKLENGDGYNHARGYTRLLTVLQAETSG
jgi:hypothetical protein